MAFFSEMTSRVLPTLGRLGSALQQAQTVALELHSLLSHTEQEAASVFQGGPAGLNLATPAANSAPMQTVVISPTGLNFVAGQVTPALGKLSEKYETGGRGPGTVSSGKNDPGGASYGSYQLTSQTVKKVKGKQIIVTGGRVEEFLKSPEGQKWRREFDGLTPGSSEFSSKWKEIATRDAAAFHAAQHTFTKRTHYDVQTQRLNNKLGLDVSKRSTTLQNVVWSTAVQHGPRTSLINSALKGQDLSKMSDREIIQEIYEERSRKHPTYKKRYKDELADALQLLNKETDKSHP